MEITRRGRFAVAGSGCPKPNDCDVSGFFPSTKSIAEFSSGREPNPGDKVIYVTGAFDLFHVGHLKFLEKAMKEGDYLLVGIHTDPVANKYKGENYPIMNLHERVLTVLSIRYVDEVLIGAPYNVTEEIMNFYNVHLVVHGSTPIELNPDGSDPFAVRSSLWVHHQVELCIMATSVVQPYCSYGVGQRKIISVTVKWTLFV
ncbi:hypothetical protein NP493_120g04058 [Ridgeia piscesae]|uniref:ethanolamine-phosphate cytidylyltransferase n=1 Tax=Ridgeia piscesae TaxID=27915 RepID=A0AAD9P687_RIDPI|nr:hypothetical protein NP493_120g04058 [Ridgeia piscesae]